MSNTFGERFRITTFGESHGPAMGVVIDGCPAGLPFAAADLVPMLSRDVPDPVVGTTRREPNEAEVLSGLHEGRTLGTPIAIVVRNRDARSCDYEDSRARPRPGHGDWTWRARSRHVDPRGGGRGAGRECIARLAAGAVAARMLEALGIACRGRVHEMAGVRVRDARDLERAREAVLAANRDGDSTGGLVRVCADGLPAGVGDPVFGKMQAVLGHALLSIGGVKSFEVGLGKAHARLRGSRTNDPLVLDGGAVRTSSNRSGGIVGGITNGMRLRVTIAVKPTPSIRRTQETVDLERGEAAEISCEGRFDLNFAPRVAVVAEAMTAIVLVDRLLAAGWIHPLRFDESPLLHRLAPSAGGGRGESLGP